MLIKKGDDGEHVAEVKRLLGYECVQEVERFDENLEEQVRNFQKEKGLSVDGIVGPDTLSKLVDVTTDLTYFKEYSRENKKGNLLDKGIYLTENNLRVYRRHLKPSEYVSDDPTSKQYIFIHHTAGSEDPFATAYYWNNDSRGRIGTHFIIGGKGTNGNSRYNGEVVECIPSNAYAWHLGDNGSHHMHTHSISIELTNWGWLKEKNGVFYNYLDKQVPEDQVVDLCYEFRGYRHYHKYTDEQLDSLRLLLEHLSEEHDISLQDGLYNMIKQHGGADAFEYHDKVYNGETKGLLTHTNVRTDKFDCSPQPNLIDLIEKVAS